MDKFGTYQIMLKYFPPDLSSGVETTDLSFEYVSGTTSTPAAASSPSTNTTAPPQPQGVEIILMAYGTGVIVDNSTPYLPQNRAAFNWTQTGERQNFNLVDIEAGTEVWNDIGASGELTASFSICNLTYTQVDG